MRQFLHLTRKSHHWFEHGASPCLCPNFLLEISQNNHFATFFYYGRPLSRRHNVRSPSQWNRSSIFYSRFCYFCYHLYCNQASQTLTPLHLTLEFAHKVRYLGKGLYQVLSLLNPKSRPEYFPSKPFPMHLPRRYHLLVRCSPTSLSAL